MTYLSSLARSLGFGRRDNPAATGCDPLKVSVDEALRHPTRPEFCLTLTPKPGEQPLEMFSRLAIALKDLDATPLMMMIFGPPRAAAGIMEALKMFFDKTLFPVTWIGCEGAGQSVLSGIHAFATRTAVETLVLEDRIVGSVFDSGGVRHCLLGGLRPYCVEMTRSGQTQEALETLHSVLTHAGFSLGDVIRTWFSIDDLFSWCGDFNEVRNQMYSDVAFRAGSMPASTEVAGSNTAGAAMVLGAWAAQSKHACAGIEGLPWPLQNPAPADGRSSSRAVEVSSSHGRHLIISGTTSIAPDGQTLWIGDAPKQIAETMKVVETILDSRKFKLSDTTRATAYFRNASDIPAFSLWCAAKELTLPFVPVHCGLCRDDLLFQLELDAWTDRKLD